MLSQQIYHICQYHFISEIITVLYIAISSISRARLDSTAAAAHSAAVNLSIHDQDRELKSKAADGRKPSEFRPSKKYGAGAAFHYHNFLYKESVQIQALMSTGFMTA